MGAAVFHSTYSEHGEEEHNSLRAKRLFSRQCPSIECIRDMQCFVSPKKGNKDESPK